MYIHSLHLEHFGPVHTLSVELRSHGVHAFVGPNASGKTQVLGAILAALVGSKAVRLDSNATFPSTVRLVLAEPPKFEVIALSAFARKSAQPALERTVTTLDGTPSDELLSHRMRDMLGPGDHPALLISEHTRSARLTEAILRQVVDAPAFAGLSSYVQAELRRLAHMGEGIASQALERLAALVQAYAVRRHSSSRIPLLVDDAFVSLDHVAEDSAWRLLSAIGEHDQVVVFTSRSGLPAATLMQLPSARKNDISLMAYNYRTVGASASRRSRKPRYEVGQQLPLDETRHVEYKEVKGLNPVASIESLVDQYVVAFLNSGRPGVGQIIWGVRDVDRAVVGVELSDADRDHIRRVITQKLHQITPTLAPSAYEVELHPLSAPPPSSARLFLVEVRVPSSKEHILYATGKQEVFIKTDGGKKKLTTLEIQKELIRRITDQGAGHTSL